MTALERSLLETVQLIQPEVEKSEKEIVTLKESLKDMTSSKDLWYRYYSDELAKVVKLEKEIKTLKEQKEEQDAGTSDSSDNLKEAI